MIPWTVLTLAVSITTPIAESTLLCNAFPRLVAAEFKELHPETKEDTAELNNALAVK